MGMRFLNFGRFLSPHRTVWILLIDNVTFESQIKIVYAMIIKMVQCFFVLLFFNVINGNLCMTVRPVDFFAHTTLGDLDL